MSEDLAKQVAVAVFRCCMLAVSNRDVLKSLMASAYLALLTGTISLIQPVALYARDFPQYRSADEIVAQLKERLKLTGEQEPKVRSIIEDSVMKSKGLLANSSQDRKTVKSQMQEIQWSTDMRLAGVLTKEQMKEYEKFREEQSDEKQQGNVQSERPSRGRGVRGF